MRRRVRRRVWRRVRRRVRRVVRGTRCMVRAVQRMFTAQPLSSVATPTYYLLTTHYSRLTASLLLELGLGDHPVVIAV